LKNQFWLAMAAFFILNNGGWAQGLPSLTEIPSTSLQTSPAVTPAGSVPKPIVMMLKDKTPDSARFNLPKPPGRYVDDTDLDLINDADNVPKLNDAALRTLTEGDVLEQIPVVNKADKKSNRYYWHPFKGWNYVHYSEGGRQWYGWRTGESFHWLLWSAGHFWWYDRYAERWLYFDRGFWWWQSLKKTNQIQVFLDDGHFHVCDVNGVLGDDLMQTGVEEDVPDETPRPTSKPAGHQPID
jgi:hypothetical protein